MFQKEAAGVVALRRQPLELRGIGKIWLPSAARLSTQHS